MLRAYGILVDDPDISGITAKLDRASASGQCRALFREVKACSSKRHIHVPCEEKYLKDLIERAEPELSGNPTERHAKSMEIAQEEVLTCLGVHLHDRFFRIQQKLKVEGKAWQLLFAISVDALRRNIEVAFERNRGCQSVDMICLELMLDEDKMQTPKRPRTKKKKGLKAMSQPVDETQPSDALASAADAGKTASSCLCTSNSAKREPLSSDANHNSVLPATPCSAACSVVTAADNRCTSGSTALHESCCVAENQPSGHSDLGYASDGDCESCSSQGLARNGGESENSHSSGCCSPSSSAAAAETDGSVACQCDQLGIKCRTDCQLVGSCSPAVSTTAVDGCALEGCSLSRYATAPSLEDMLMASEDDCGDFEISEDVIRQYKANEQMHARERLALRQTLRQKFESMQQRNQQWQEDATSVMSSSHCKDASATVHA